MADTPRANAELLREMLAHNDALCPNCAYALRGLTGDRCPECNQRLELGVRLAVDRTGALLMSVIACSCGAAPMLAVMCVVTMVMIHERGSPPPEIRIWIIWLPCIFGPSFAAAAVFLSLRRGRRWFRGLSDKAARLVVVLSWTTTCALGLAYVIRILTKM